MLDATIMYEQKINEKNSLLKKLNNKLNLISFFRLLTLLVLVLSIYFFEQAKSEYYYLLIGVSAISFIYFVRKFFVLKSEKQIENIILKFYTQEKSSIEKHLVFHDSGNEFIDTDHLYTYDLDVFGKHSLFEHINRNYTYLGKRELANDFIQPDLSKISERQIAINELKDKLEWRAKFYSLSFLSNDNEQMYVNLQNWINIKRKKNHKLLNAISFISPILLLLAIALYFIQDLNVIQHVLFFNLIVFMFNFGRIKSEILNADQLHKTLFKYSDLLKHIENENFNSELLKSYQHILKDGDVLASAQIKQLANIYEDLNNAQNLLSSIISNSLFLYHIHTLRKLDDWNAKNLNQINTYLEIIAKFESLNAFANFAYNNSEFVFAEISNDKALSFIDIKHPLILKNECVANTVLFDDYELKILTGSNMSGKSTFLRALALNILIANTGSVCAASSFKYKPVRIASSMRNNDSISTKSSYFYSEVLRLQKIFAEIKSSTYFVFLDEILKGTNSEDKREGSKEIIRKFLKYDFYGVIATHDLEVCEIENELPNKVSNNCFEVEIANNELKFDYKLKPGICKNKSASFLINKYIN
jgi:DNA mismatch repair ATPase MutS